MSVCAYAPASIGNVGVGFDTLGASLEPIDGSELGDKVYAHFADKFELKLEGPFVNKLPKDPKQNIVTLCHDIFNNAMKVKALAVKPVSFTLDKRLPVGSGLGSSASSVVASFVALNALYDYPFNQDELLSLMGEAEGCVSGSVHYDNVAPSYVGGLTLMTGLASPSFVNVPVFENWYWVICYSGVKVSTAEARKILPQKVDMHTALSYGRYLSNFVHASFSKNEALAQSTIVDVIAEPYRKSLLPGFDEARSTSVEFGAKAFGISGSGPTVFAVCDSLEHAQSIHKWLCENYIRKDYGFGHICRLRTEGASVEVIKG